MDLIKAMFTATGYEPKEKLFLLALAYYFNQQTKSAPCSYGAINEYTDLTFAEIGEITLKLSNMGLLVWETTTLNEFDVYHEFRFQGELKQIVDQC
jgi:hypothetical protein